LSFDGQIIGDVAVGTGTWKTKDGEDRFTFRARISRAKVRTNYNVDRSRTWEPQGAPLEADPALAARAIEESLVPIRPGEPGKQGFHSARPIHISVGRDQVRYFAIHAPTIPFEEVPGATRYRMLVKSAAGSWNCELAKPWQPLSPLWKDVLPGRCEIRATALDASGKELGQARVPDKAYGYIGGKPTKRPPAEAGGFDQQLKVDIAAKAGWGG
jgi:hypothetical protein